MRRSRQTGKAGDASKPLQPEVRLRSSDATDGAVAKGMNDVGASRSAHGEKPCAGAAPAVRSQAELTLVVDSLLLGELVHQTTYSESDWDIRSPEDYAAYDAASDLIQRFDARNGSRRRILFPLPRDMGIVYWIDQFLIGTLVTADMQEWPQLDRAARGALARMGRLFPVPQHVSNLIEAFDSAKNECERVFQKLLILREGWSYRDEPFLGMSAWPDPVGAPVVCDTLYRSATEDGLLSAHARMRLARP